MATTIRELLVALGVKADNRALKEFDRNIGKVKAGMGAAFRGATLLTGAVLGTTAAMFKIASSTATAGDEAAKMGKRIGLTAAEVQELSFAAELAGASSADLEAGMRRLTKTASDADRGLKTATDAFGDLGIEVHDASGELKDPLELFLETADAMSKITNSTKRAALAQEVFGRGGAKLVPLLKEGRAGIEAMREEARLLGFVFDKEASESAERFVDDLLELRKIGEGLRNTIGLALIPVFTQLMEAFRDWFVANREVIKQRVERVAERLADSLRRLFRVLTRVDRFVRETLGGWGQLLAVVATAIGVLVGLKGFASMITILQALHAAFLILQGIGVATLGTIAAQVAAAVAVFALLFLAVEDLVVFMRGGESAIGAFFDRFERGREILPRIQELFDATEQAGSRLVSTLDRLGNVVGRLLGPVLEALRPVLDAVLAGLSRMTELEIERQIERLESWTGALESLARFFDRVTGSIDRFLGKADTAGEFLAGLFEIRKAVLGETATTAIDFAARAAITGQLGGAPGGGLSGFTPAGAAPGGNGGGGAVSIEGDNITIQGVNMGEAELRRVFDERDREKRRQLAQALQGGDV